MVKKKLCPERGTSSLQDRLLRDRATGHLDIRKRDISHPLRTTGWERRQHLSVWEYCEAFELSSFATSPAPYLLLMWDHKSFLLKYFGGWVLSFLFLFYSFVVFFFCYLQLKASYPGHSKALTCPPWTNLLLVTCLCCPQLWSQVVQPRAQAPLCLSVLCEAPA